MKRTFAWLLALLLMLGSFAFAEDEAFIVGSTTAMSGGFMDGFGNNTADLDVRALLHGLSLIYFDADRGVYDFNDRVVREAVREKTGGNYRYTIALRGGLKYSDGSEITAADYAFSILLAFSPEMAELGIKSADHILGGADYRSGSAETLKGLRVAGNRLIITVDASRVPEFYELALLDFKPYPIGEIAPGCQVESSGEGASIAGDFTADGLRKTLLDPEKGYVSHPKAVSGPYTLVSYEGTQAEFALNPNYPGNPDGVKPSIGRIVYKLVKNEEAVALLESGEIDLFNKAMKADVIDAALAQPEKIASAAYPRSGAAFIHFACDRVTDPAIRQAIAHCFDKAAFIDGYLGSHGEAVDGYYGVGQWMVQEGSLEGLHTYPLDREAAAALLKDAEPADLELTILYPEGNAVGEFLTGSFTEKLAEIGVTLKVEALPFTDLLQAYYRQAETDADMIFLATNFATVFDPAASFAPGGALNRHAIADEELYQLALDMRKTTPGDKAAYLEKWQAFQVRFTEVLPAIPIYSNTYYDLYTPALKGYDPAAAQTWAEALIGATVE